MAGEETTWRWQGGNCAPHLIEAATPGWFRARPLVQVSDCRNWSEVSQAFAAMWKQDLSTEAWQRLVEEATRGGQETLQRIGSIFRFVQDEHRYLSVNLELGGQIPTSPDIVARRRFGDCKDLSFLLANLLGQIGVPARPILVSTQLGRRVRDYLPSPNLFNHVIVEWEWQGKARWIDPTMKRQGGDPLNRFVPDYGMGLPVDAAATDLVAAPEEAGSLSGHEVRETLLVDTSGKPSHLTARGGSAENLRLRFATSSRDEIAQERLQQCAERFREAHRVGEMNWRDDLGRNVFEIAEHFTVDKFLSADQRAGCSNLSIAGIEGIRLSRSPGWGLVAVCIAL